MTPNRFLEFARITEGDRAALERLEKDIAARAQILAEGPTALEQLQQKRLEMARGVELAEAMLAFGREKFGLEVPQAPLPVEADAREHYRDDPTVTQANPLPGESGQDGGDRG